MESIHIHTPLALLLAASSSSNQYTPTFPGGILAWIICYSRRRQQIGGWLLFYYWQLYSGVLMTLLFFVIAFQSYVPESFDDRGRYYLFLASTVPSLTIFMLELAVATMLVSVRTQDLLKLLRALMIAYLLAATIGTVIDANFFPDNLAFDFIAIVPALIWLAYFFRSRRVAHVFKSHDWDLAVNALYPLQPPATT